MKNIENNKEKAWIVLLFLIFAVFIYTCFKFDISEARVINGKSLDVNEGWYIRGETDEPKLTLPHALLSRDGSPVKIYTKLEEKYTGLMLELMVNNAYIRVTLNGDTVYENNADAASSKSSNMVYLPDYGQSGELEITLTPIDISSSMYIREAIITRGDIAIIRQIKDKLFELACCIVILLCATAVAMLEMVRKRLKWREDHLFRLVFLCVILFTYSISNTHTLSMFFGNEPFFQQLEGVTLQLIPIILFFYYGSDRKTEWNITDFVILGIAALAGFAGILGLVPALDFDTGITVYIAVLIVCINCAVYAVLDRNKLWIGELLWIAAFIVFAVINIIRQTRYSFFQDKDPMMLSIAILIITIWNTARFIEDYKEVLGRSEQEAIRANEAKGIFLANMSHEIRTPINAVLGMDEMILRESKEPAIRNYAMDIYSAGNTLLALINDILDISKIESGKMSVVPVDYDVVTMLNDVINLIAPKAKDKNLEFIVNVDPMTPAKLHGDDKRLKQIMTNILSNAVKYTDEGSVIFRIVWKDVDEETGKLCCEVTDTGIGIKEEDIPKLFEKYSRFDENLHNNTEGTGLGMSITFKLLSLMGSKLKVRSKYGQGSSFKFAVTQQIIDGTEIGEFKKKMVDITKGYSHTRAFTAPNAYVLVVDDNVMNRRVFMSLLKETQIRIKEAGSGKECLKLIQKEHFDLIFMDHMMPEMDGIETLHRMKALAKSKCKDTPVIILTANAIAGMKEEYLRKGFDGYLSKPIVPEELESMIMEAIPDKLVATKIATASDTINIIDIQGVDSNYLSLHFNDKTSQIEALKEYYKNSRIYIDKLNELNKGIYQQDGIDNYRICVHEMKNSAATIGAMSLYGLAKALEDAAKTQSADAVSLLHPIFKREWVTFSKELGKMLGYKSRERKPAEQKTTTGMLATLENAIKNFDTDTANAVIRKMSVYDYGKRGNALFGKLKLYITEMDAEKSIEYIKKFRALARAGFEQPETDEIKRPVMDNTFLTSIARSIMGGICVFEINNETHSFKPKFLNEEFYRIINDSPKNVNRMFSNMEKYIEPQDLPIFRQGINEVLQNRGSVEFELRINTLANNKIWLHFRANLYMKEGAQNTICATVYDCTEQKEREIKLENLAYHDGLTGLSNKIATKEQIEASIEKNKKDGTTGALFILDADDFKHINDTYGHQTGDEVLKKISKSMQETFRNIDVKGRIGGDEFMIFMNNVKEDEIYEIADRMEKLVMQSSMGEVYEFETSMSIGIALFPQHGATYEELYKKADAALYQVKRLGKATFNIYSPDEEQI